MYRNPAIRKIIDASHLTNFIKEKFALPARPVTSARYIHLRHKPTKTASDAMGYGTVISFLPGHVDLSLSMADLAIAKTDFDPDLKDHPKLSDVLARLGIDDKLTMGLAPDTAPGNLKRTFRTMGSMGVEYNNIEFKARPWYADYFATKNQDLKSNDLGNLRAAHLSLLYKICREQLQRDYSLGGRDKPPPESIWTLEEFITYFTTGIAPTGHDNCIDFIKRCLEALARYEAPGSPSLQTFLYQLGFVTQPQDLAELTTAYFKPDTEGFLSFSAAAPRPEPQLSEEQAVWADMQEASAARYAKLLKDKLDTFRKSSNYASFAKAFGGKPEVFDAIAEGLHRDGSIFDSIFASPADLAWGTTFFKGLGERLAGCTEQQGVAAVSYHRDTYPGRITHVSVIGFSGKGAVSISHHESIPISDKPAMVDGLAIGTLGIPSASYNTADLHNSLQNRTPDKHIAQADLPIVKSYTASGPPMVTFTLMDDFAAFEAFNVQMAAQGQGPLGRQWLYGVDPNQTLAQLATDVKSGKLQLTPLKLAMLRCDRAPMHHPKLPPPGAKGDFTPGLYTNNCGRMTILALLAGRAPALQGVNYSEAMDLVDVAGILLKAGLMPNTDPEVLDRMRRAGSVYNKDKQRVERHPASFLALGQLSGWSNAAPGTPGTYPPDVDRHPPKDAAAEIKARQDGDTKLAETIRKNEQTFLDQLGAKPAPLPAPVWVVRELSLDHDKALIEAHLAALSDDDRYLRFGVSNLAAASSRLFSAKSGHFGVFDPTGKTMVGLGLGSFLVTADVPSLDVGLSVLPAYRKKGVAKLAVQWMMCRARNRGVRLLEVQYYSENVGSMKLLEVLGTPVHKGRFDNLILVEMAMPEADGASHLMEATHLHFSSAWPKK